MTYLSSTLVPLPLENVDTDQIIPARFLKATARENFGDHLFADLRKTPDGKPSDFVLNNPRYSGQILVAGKNFGCGSSREHAAWALSDYGFKVIVSSFFADIFKNNALNNFVLPLVISEGSLQLLFDTLEKEPQTTASIDLEKQIFTVPSLGLQESFEISPYKKECLINELNDFDYLVHRLPQIEEWEKSYTNPIAILGS